MAAGTDVEGNPFSSIPMQRAMRRDVHCVCSVFTSCSLSCRPRLSLNFQSCCTNVQIRKRDRRHSCCFLPRIRLHHPAPHHHHCLSHPRLPSLLLTHLRYPCLRSHHHHHPIRIPILCFPTHRTRTIPHFQASSSIDTALTAIDTVKAFNAQSIKLSRAMATFYALQRTSSRLCRLWGITSGSAQFVMMAMFVQAFWYGAKLVRDRKVMTILRTTISMDPTLPSRLLYSTPYCQNCQKTCSSRILTSPGARL